MSSKVHLWEYDTYINALVTNNNLNVFWNLEELGWKARTLMRQENNEIALILLANQSIANDYDLWEAILNTVKG